MSTLESFAGRLTPVAMMMMMMMMMILWFIGLADKSFGYL